MKALTKNQGGHVTLTLQGRMDTNAANAVKDDIDRQLAALEPISRLTCDLADVDYISSSGLRVLLGLAKRCHDFEVTEAQPDVYRVFEMTSFNKIMTVRRALRRMSVEGCDVIGRGGVGVVYRIDDDTIIKVFREGTSMDEVQNEVSLSKEAFVLGMPTAISFDVVRVGSQY